METNLHAGLDAGATSSRQERDDGCSKRRDFRENSVMRMMRLNKKGNKKPRGQLETSGLTMIQNVFGKTPTV
ncbi:MAG: hypothetical protein KDA87_18405 [Planctomycetales bacterium]|nr:hypothetical protein [Planctomycetales bacterium]